MQVVLHPRYGPTQSLRVWLGVCPVTKSPAISWLLDGKPSTPAPIHPLGSARPDDLLQSDNGRVFAGLYEFGPVPADTPHRIRVSVNDGAGSVDQEIPVRTLPESLPGGTDDWFNILLVSCYHDATSPPNVLKSVLLDVAKSCKPSLSLLIGDQVYLDLPTLKNFRRDSKWLADKFESDYTRNWFKEGGYREVLAVAPSIAMPDDHEYWNNYPHSSPIIQNSWTAEGRKAWEVAARQLYTAFQAHDPKTVGDETVIDIDPVSIFMSDTRTFRDENARFSMNPPSLGRLEQWVDRLNARNLTGIFVSGQSVFDPPAGAVAGKVGDKKLANYGDFKTIIEHLSSAKTPVICITGDVHWGRLIQVRDQWLESRIAFYEIITSPVSLVESVGIDQWHEATAWLGGLLRPRDPWPRHSPPNTDVAWQGTPSSRYVCTLRHGQRGNHLAVLSMRRFAGGIQARVGYFSLHPDRQYRTVSWSETFDITSGISHNF